MGCRNYKGRQWTDDLDGQTYLPEELERMVFVFDGMAFEIDLTDENAENFRKAMAPYVGAARPTSKSAVLATLPRKKRHLSSVPSPVVEDEPKGSAQNTPETQKGEESEPLSEPEGTQVPETAPKPSDFRPSEESVKPALSVVKNDDDAFKQWAPWAPHPKDDQRARVPKVRKWATAMGRPDHEVLTPEVFERWATFYRERHWQRM